jgi:drug/metabolite transporter (DMT)-like permease
MEAVFAAVTGFIFLQETMKGIQLVGCALILAAVLVSQIKAVRTSSPKIELMKG